MTPGSEMPLAGLHVFVVEDESLVLLDIEDSLQNAGATVVGPAMHLNQAIEIAKGTQRIDVALLDINVAGERVFPVAEILRAGGVPVLFASGYGKSSLTDGWTEAPVVQKPYAMDQVIQRLAKLAGLSAA